MALTLPRSEFIDEEALYEIEEKQREKVEKQGTMSDAVTDIVYETDPLSKALTGRTPENLEDETGIPADELFPPNAKILYVGDPWQRMGRELDESHGNNLTLIDYEFGEVASFVTDDENFRKEIDYRGEGLLAEINEWLETETAHTTEDIKWLEGLQHTILEAHTQSQNAANDYEYEQAADAWETARNYIEEAQRQKTAQPNAEPGDARNTQDDWHLSELARSAWYDCVHGERGFRDIPDWNNIIKPKIDALEEKLGNIPEQEKRKILDRETIDAIEEIRLKKHTEKSNVVEAVFPQLPFKSNSFDRMVASWSISAHVFAELSKDEFAVFWNETQRVLSNNGIAYIFPLDYYYEVDEILVDSLEEMKKRYPDTTYAFIDKNGYEIPIESSDYAGYGYEYTLAIYKGQRNGNNS
jgi:hypothetical protein